MVPVFYCLETLGGSTLRSVNVVFCVSPAPALSRLPGTAIYIGCDCAVPSLPSCSQQPYVFILLFPLCEPKLSQT